MYSVKVKKERQSNIELLRIVLMLMIIMHHYCVNSGFSDVIDFNNITWNTILIQFMSIGGKVGVNTFILISGYYMVNSKSNIKKVLKLILEILFYNIVIIIFLSLLGYKYSILSIIKCTVPIMFSFSGGFMANYILVYILSPITNKMVKSISEKEFRWLLGILIFYFSIVCTFLKQDTWNYFSWDLTMYLIGAYIRLHHKKVYDNRNLWIIITIMTVLLIWSSQLAVDFIGVKVGFTNWQYLMTNANKFPMLVMSISLFLIFKNIKISYNKYINMFAASTLGVLLIHANSMQMINWLWKDLLKNTSYFESDLLWVHMTVSVIGIYIICTFIDILRIKFLEIPLFNYIEKNKI